MPASLFKGYREEFHPVQTLYRSLAAFIARESNQKFALEIIENTALRSRQSKPGDVSKSAEHRY
jgi:hypothetical protein